MELEGKLLIHELISAFLEGERDGHAYVARAGHSARTLVRRLHEPRPAARDHEQLLVQAEVAVDSVLGHVELVQRGLDRGRVAPRDSCDARLCAQMRGRGAGPGRQATGHLDDRVVLGTHPLETLQRDQLLLQGRPFGDIFTCLYFLQQTRQLSIVLRSRSRTRRPEEQDGRVHIVRGESGGGLLQLAEDADVSCGMRAEEVGVLVGLHRRRVSALLEGDVRRLLQLLAPALAHAAIG